VFDTPVETPATARARWLAEVAIALEQAELVLNRLNGDVHPGWNLTELLMRIGAAKREVALLRLGRPSRSQSDPRWTKLPPWQDGDRSAV
jgi:hypothetical protein